MVGGGMLAATRRFRGSAAGGAAVIALEDAGGGAPPDDAGTEGTAGRGGSRGAGGEGGCCAAGEGRCDGRAGASASRSPCATAKSTRRPSSARARAEVGMRMGKGANKFESPKPIIRTPHAARVSLPTFTVYRK